MWIHINLSVCDDHPQFIRRKDMKNIKKLFRSKAGMELVQVAILIAIAIALGIIFKTEITSFVNKTFKALNASKF